MLQLHRTMQRQWIGENQCAAEPAVVLVKASILSASHREDDAQECVHISRLSILLNAVAVLEALLRADYGQHHCKVSQYIPGVSHARVSSDIIPWMVIASPHLPGCPQPCNADYRCAHFLSIPPLT